MWTILAFLLSGIIVGWLIRQKTSWVKWFNILASLSVFALLFFLALSAGGNPSVINNLHQMGLKALYIALSAIIGSCLLTWLFYRFIRK